MAEKGYKTINYRYILIAVFTFSLVQLVYVAIHRKEVSKNLSESVNLLSENNLAIHDINSSFESLFDIENKFRLYVNTRESVYYQDYKSQLLLLGAKLDSLQAYRNLNSKNQQTKNLTALVKDKKRNTDLFIRLKAINDSLLLATDKLSEIEESRGFYFKPFKITDIQSILSQKADTAVQVNDTPKKGLLKRIGAALVNKNTATADTIITKNNNLVQNTKITQDSLTLLKMNSLFKQSIKKLVANQNLVKARENEIIVANMTLLNELLTILKELETQEYNKNIANASVLKVYATNSLKSLNSDTRIVLILALVLALVIIFNIWRLYNYEHQLVEAKNDAVKQTNLKRDYLAHLSHEIRTPLNSIVGFSSQLSKNPSEEESRSYIGAITESSNMLLSLVNDVLDLTKLESGKLNLNATNFNPQKAVKDVVNTLQVLAQSKKLDLVANFFFEDGTILKGDEYRFKQVLVNLINNAIKFTSTGSVTVNCKLVSASNITLEIIDTGVGISKQNITVLFDEFTQVLDNNSENRKDGSGLGLSITKKIIEAQNGTIIVESEFGKGSRFIVNIPYAVADAPVCVVESTSENDNATIALHKPLNLDPNKVLIVDDNLLNIKLLTIILKKWGIACDEAANGEIAFQLFEDNEYAAVLTDIQMPVMNGVELTKKIRLYSNSEKANIPIFAITANVISEELAGYIAAGMNGHIIKPFQEQTLYQILQKLSLQQSTAS
ncbi:ATP-binding protein [Pedobacter alpinus]|uniref:histidine kinase n=1 Tax=Pedobacter alpinus TaxID=1590643 RepID=A0ABW5TRS2_9SPHI